MFDSNLFFSDSLSFTNKVRALTFRYRSNPWEVFLEKGVPKIYSKSTGEHPCQSAISIKLLCNFIKITLRNGCSPVKLLHILRITFRKNCSRGMLLQRFWCNDFLRSQDFWKHWFSPQTQDVNWTYIIRPEDLFWTSYVRSNYVLCLRGYYVCQWIMNSFEFFMNSFDPSLVVIE